MIFDFFASGAIKKQTQVRLENVCLPVVLKLDEAEAVLEGDLPEGAEPLEELFHVPLADVVPDVADVYACPRHNQLALTSDIL